MAPTAITTKPMSNVIPITKSSSATPKDVTTTLNYLDATVSKKLDSNDGYGFDPASAVKTSKPFPVVIKDVRGREKEFTLDKNGFQYLHDIKYEGVTDWKDLKQLDKFVRPVVEREMGKLTGANKFVVYINRVRYEGNNEGEQMSSGHSPSHGVHTDLTHAATPDLLKRVIPDQAERERLLKKRFVVCNFWCPIQTILRDPFALCDVNSVNPDSFIADRHVRDFSFDHRAGDIMKQAMEYSSPPFSEEHQWYYLSEQKPSEPVIFKELDSNPDTDIRVVHSAFIDPKYTKYPPRQSFEFKVFNFFDDEAE